LKGKLALVNSANLVAFFPFDGFNQTVPFLSKVYGATETDVSVSGKALYFDGDSHIDIMGVDLACSSHQFITFGAWVKASAPPNTLPSPGQFDAFRIVLSGDPGDDRGSGRALCIDFRGETQEGGGWSVFTGTAGEGTGGAMGALPVKSSQWSFVAAAYNQKEGTVLLYVDGASLSGPARMSHGLSFLRVGGNGTAGSGFHGVIDEVFIFDGVLSLADLDFLASGKPQELSPAAGIAGYSMKLDGYTVLEFPHASVASSSLALLDTFSFGVWFSPTQDAEEEAGLASLGVANNIIFALSVEAELSPVPAYILTLRFGQSENIKGEWAVMRRLKIHYISPGKWCHVGVGWDSSTVEAQGSNKFTIFIDGVLSVDEEWEGIVLTPDGAHWVLGAGLGIHDTPRHTFFQGRA